MADKRDFRPRKTADFGAVHEGQSDVFSPVDGVPADGLGHVVEPLHPPR